MITCYGAVVDRSGNVVWAGRHGLTAERWQAGTYWGIATTKADAIKAARNAIPETTRQAVQEVTVQQPHVEEGIQELPSAAPLVRRVLAARNVYRLPSDR